MRRENNPAVDRVFAALGRFDTRVRKSHMKREAWYGALGRSMESRVQKELFALYAAGGLLLVFLQGVRKDETELEYEKL